MDKLDQYRQIVRRLIRDYAGPDDPRGTIQSEVVIDPERDHYEVVTFGWHDRRRMHYTVVHVDIADGKIWVRHDATDRPFAAALLEAGVPKSDIVLDFHPEELRHHTGFAVR